MDRLGLRLLIVGLGLGGFVQGALAQSDDPNFNRSRYEQAMYDYFGRSPFFAIPIFLSGTRESGDTLKIGTYDKYSPRNLCFSSIGAPKLADSDLTKQQEIDGFAIAGAGNIALKKIVSAAADAKYDRIDKFTVAFTNVHVDETALYILKTNADNKKCPFIKKLFDGKNFDDNIVLTNFVVHGQKEFTIVLEKKVGGGADIGLVQGTLNKIFGNVKVSAKGDNQTHSSIDISSEKTVPVAFRPAFVSIDDVLAREGQIKEGIDKALDEIWKKRDVKSAKQLLEKRSDIANPPDKIYANMLFGNLTEFDPRKSERDQRYMNLVTLNVLVSSLVFGTPLPR